MGLKLAFSLWRKGQVQVPLVYRIRYSVPVLIAESARRPAGPVVSRSMMLELETLKVPRQTKSAISSKWGQIVETQMLKLQAYFCGEKKEQPLKHPLS